MTRVVLVGHSTGGGACIEAGRTLSPYIDLQSLAYGFLGPYFAGATPLPLVSTDIRNTLVMHGSLDMVTGADAMRVYNAAGSPKTSVTIPGANHFGYTDLCTLGNNCDAAVVPDPHGTISRDGQQRTAAAYLAALMRYYTLHDATAQPYLSGRTPVEGLDFYGVTGIQVQQHGVNPPPVAH